METTVTYLDAIHPFERAGLGKAPFRFIGVSEKVYMAHPGAPLQPAGTCDYCGNGIRYCFGVASADGRKFIVGCDCVYKLNKASNRAATMDRLTFDVKRAEARLKAEARHKSARARIERAKATLEAHPALFTDKPHPHPYYASQGKTLRDNIVFLLTQAGDRGGVGAAKFVEKTVADARVEA